MYMRWLALLVALSANAFADVSAPGPPATAPATAESGRAKVILTTGAQRSRWLTFALYAGGRVVYPVQQGWSNEQFMTVQLSPVEEAALLAGLQLGRVGDMKPPFQFGSDGATECIHTFSGGEPHSDCVWGSFEESADAPSEWRAPPEIVAIWHRLAHFSSPRAQHWMPSSLRVVAGPPRDKPCPPRIQESWPATWPVPDDRALAALRRGLPWAFSVKPAELPTVQRLEFWSRPGPLHCAQGVFVRGALVQIGFEMPQPPYPH